MIAPALPRRAVIIALALMILVGSGVAAFRWPRRQALPEGLLQANGRIEGDHVTVASKFAGRIRRVTVREGDAVTPGTVVMELDDAQTRARVTQAAAAVAQADARLEQARQAVLALDARVRAGRVALQTLGREVPIEIEIARAGVEQARAMREKGEAAEQQASRDRQRFAELAASGLVAPQASEHADLAWAVARKEAEAARTALLRAEKQLTQALLGEERIAAEHEELTALRAEREQAAASLAQAEAGLRQARAALAEAESVLADLTIVAPIAGVVTTRVRDVGEVVGAGAPLLDLVDLDRLYLKVYVPEKEIGRLALGQRAQIYVDAFPGRAFLATVRQIGSRAEFTPKEVQTPDERVKLVYAVKLYLDENPERRLTPGLPADAVIRWKDDAPWARPQW